MIDERRATQMRHDLVRVSELGKTLNAIAAMTAGDQTFAGPVAAMMQTFHALQTRASRSAAAAGVYLDDPAAPSARGTVSDAAWELRPKFPLIGLVWPCTGIVTWWFVLRRPGFVIM